MKLQDSDREFVVQFVLLSGSLKAVARSYGVSYPTIRAMLDGVIDRLGVVLAGGAVDPMSEVLADLIERGELTTASARKVRECHRRQLTYERGDRS